MPSLITDPGRCASGVALIEVLLALLLLSLATGAFLRTWGLSSQRIDAAMHHSQATALVQELAQTLRSQSTGQSAAVVEEEPWGKIPGCDKPRQ